MEKGRRPNRRCSRDWSSALNLILVILPLRKSTQTFQNQLDQDQYYWFY